MYNSFGAKTFAVVLLFMIAINLHQRHYYTYLDVSGISMSDVAGPCGGLTAVFKIVEDFEHTLQCPGRPLHPSTEAWFHPLTQAMVIYIRVRVSCCHAVGRC